MIKMINHIADDKIILQGNDTKISCYQLKSYVSGYQNQLINQKSENCLLFSDNTLEFIAGLLACYYLGVKVSLPPNDSVEMIEIINADVRIGKLYNSLKLKTSKNEIIQYNKDPTITIFTSGSTGKPKPIKRRFNQLLLEIEEINSLWFTTYDSQTVIASTVSYQHIYGLLFAVLLPLKRGFKIHNKIIPFEESLHALNSKIQSMVVISSPAFLKRLTNLNYHSNNHMLLFSSGGLLTYNQHQQAENILNSRIVQVYGSSETGGIASKCLDQNWRFFPSVSTQINQSVLRVKSPFCYTDEWHNTNDIIEINGSGFELLGRSDRIVKIEEKRVSLIQVEEAIAQFKGVTDVHIICLNDKRQYLAAAIVIQTQLSQIDAKKQLKLFLKDKVEHLAIPRKIRFVQQLPLNSQGKLIHKTIEKLFNN